jgi:succinate dehydrogenase / fumarate reductase flavoprotein subunit
MARNRRGLEEALEKVRALRAEFWKDVNVRGSGEELNQCLEAAGRVADCFELGELMCIDAWHREESCGGHFREEHQTEEGEAKRDDEHFAYVAAWEHTGDLGKPRLHREKLEFPNVHIAQRSYK